MARKPTTTFNSKKGPPGYVYYLLFLALPACKSTTPGSGLKLVSEAKIEEEGNNVLHGLPLSMQLLDDSLVGIRLDASRYNIYNYYTGKIVNSPLPDSNILPELLQQARAYSSRDYQLLSLREGREIGEPVLSAEGVFYNKEERQYYLFFTASFIVDTFITVKGVQEPAAATHRVYYVARLDRHFRVRGGYSLLKPGYLAPAFLFGGLMLQDRLLVPNVGLSHIDTPGYGMLCGIGLKQGFGIVESIPVPFDGRSKAQRKNHILEKVSFAGIDGQAYYISDGRRILYCKDAQFETVYTLDSNEHVYNLYYNHSRDLLYIHTCFGEPADLKGSKMFSLNVPGKKPGLVDSSSKIRYLDFISNTQVLAVCKNSSDESYTFSLYAY
jgi:hypothetical protein